MATVVTTVTSNNFARIARQLPEAAGEVVEDTTKRIETRIKLGMEGPHSGRMYGAHQASAPGEMPAADTSNLVNAINSEMTSQTEGVVHTGDVDYAIYLEYGAARIAAGATDMSGVRSILFPRPYMTPAAEAERQHFIDQMSDLEGRLV